MSSFHYFGKKLQHLCSCSCIKASCLGKSCFRAVSSVHHYLLYRVNSFWVQLSYFLSVSFIGFLVLRGLKPRSLPFRPNGLDVFFMSASATTVSSMSTVEIEVFSNAQLVTLTVLMLLGSEVFTSMLGLYLMKSKYRKHEKNETNKVDSVALAELGSADEMESGFAYDKQISSRVLAETESMVPEDPMYKPISCLGHVVLGYLIVVLGLGSSLVTAYTSYVPSAEEILKNKGIHVQTFSIFTIVSTFANCGFIPTNENMIIFRKNSGLLLLLIPQVLLGNTLFPAGLRFAIWVLRRFSKRDEFKFLLKNTRDLDYLHLLPTRHSLFLVATNLGFIAVQSLLYCAMEWNSEGLDTMTAYQKIVGVLFQSVNSRHSGENIVDLSTVSAAVLVLYVVMMYLPPYTSFLPITSAEKSLESNQRKKKKAAGERLVDYLKFSQLSYLAIFIILICIIERKKLKDDPLNFTLLNITIEVISAYGNVGFTTGYSCKRQLNPDGLCKDTMYGFVGRWSSKGKLILIIVMFFGRLKKFNLNGGKAWKLL